MTDPIYANICYDEFPVSCIYFEMRSKAPPRWFSGECIGLMTNGNFSFRRIFLPLTSAEACEKSSQWLWKEKLC